MKEKTTTTNKQTNKQIKTWWEIGHCVPSVNRLHSNHNYGVTCGTITKKQYCDHLEIAHSLKKSLSVASESYWASQYHDTKRKLIKVGPTARVKYLNINSTI